MPTPAPHPYHLPRAGPAVGHECNDASFSSPTQSSHALCMAGFGGSSSSGKDNKKGGGGSKLPKLKAKSQWDRCVTVLY